MPSRSAGPVPAPERPWQLGTHLKGAWLTAADRSWGEARRAGRSMRLRPLCVSAGGTQRPAAPRRPPTPAVRAARRWRPRRRSGHPRPTLRSPPAKAHSAQGHASSTEDGTPLCIQPGARSSLPPCRSNQAACLGHNPAPLQLPNPWCDLKRALIRLLVRTPCCFHPLQTASFVTRAQQQARQPAAQRQGRRSALGSVFLKESWEHVHSSDSSDGRVQHHRRERERETLLGNRGPGAGSRGGGRRAGPARDGNVKRRCGVCDWAWSAGGSGGGRAPVCCCTHKEGVGTRGEEERRGVERDIHAQPRRTQPAGGPSRTYIRLRARPGK